MNKIRTSKFVELNSSILALLTIVLNRQPEQTESSISHGRVRNRTGSKIDKRGIR
jgi:hypothetical protein